MSNKARVWLYKEGNECSAITGGWNISSYTNTSSPYLTKNSDHVYFSCGATNPLYNAGYSYFKASKVINLSYFNKMGFRATTQNSNQHRAHVVGFYTAVGSSSVLCGITNAWNTSNVTNTIYELDISTYDSNGAPFVYTQCNDAGPYRMLLYEYYLDAEADIISISQQNNSLLQFSLNNLGNLLTFTQIDVLANGRIIKTYNENLTSISYNFDRDVMDWGDNEISIRATYTQGNDVYGTVDLVSGTKYQNNLAINDFFRLESQDDEKIIISSNNITDLVYINQVDILTNGRVIQSYTENLDSITYEFDETLMDWGDNEISIQATYTENELTKTCTIISDVIYKKEVVLEEFDPIVDLPSTSTLKEVMQRFSVIESTHKAISNNLKNLLLSKGFEVGENPRLSNMVKLVNELSNNNSAEITEYINRITELEEEIDVLQSKKLVLYDNGTSNMSFESYPLKTSHTRGTEVLSGDFLRIFITSNNNSVMSRIGTTDTIDLTDYKTIYIDWEIERDHVIDLTYHGLEISTSKVFDNGKIGYLAYSAGNACSGGGRRIETLNLANINTNVYISIFTSAYGYNSQGIKIYKIWIEK